MNPFYLSFRTFDFWSCFLVLSSALCICLARHSREAAYDPILSLPRFVALAIRLVPRPVLRFLLRSN